MSACIRSGYCCQTAPCLWGHAEPGTTVCVHLTGDGPGRYACGRYDEIMAADPDQLVAPAFGAGCCSTLNPVRRRIHTPHARFTRTLPDSHA